MVPPVQIQFFPKVNPLLDNCIYLFSTDSCSSEHEKVILGSALVGWRRLKCTTAIFVKYCIFWDAKFHLKTTFQTLTKTFTVGYLPFPLASSIQIKLWKSKNILVNILENSRLDVGIIFGTQFIKTHMKRNEKIRKQWHKIRSKNPPLPAACGTWGPLVTFA